MRKSVMLLVPVAILVAFSLLISACKSHVTPAKPKLSFTEATKTVSEDGGTIDINMVLDKAASEDFTVTYTLTGTARDKVTAGTTKSYDYEITSDYLETKILKGETTGVITIKLYSDFGLEDDETIIISITDVDNQNIEITRDDSMTITVDQEDGMVILLEWPDSTNVIEDGINHPKYADMDLFVRAGASVNNWDGILTGSVSDSGSGPELVFLPKVVNYAAYGVSYTYYNGTLDPLEFTSSFIDFANGDIEPEEDYYVTTGSYSLDNINMWDDVSTTLVVQTFTKDGDSFSSPTAITTPPEGSRTASRDLHTSTLTKQNGSGEPLSKTALKILKRN